MKESIKVVLSDVIASYLEERRSIAALNAAYRRVEAYAKPVTAEPDAAVLNIVSPKPDRFCLAQWLQSGERSAAYAMLSRASGENLIPKALNPGAEYHTLKICGLNAGMDWTHFGGTGADPKNPHGLNVRAYKQESSLGKKAADILREIGVPKEGFPIYAGSDSDDDG
ncbi:MAG: hypothetical protein FWF69_03160 [Firmicutes bacterium]|nr:hypothetical protein [Bacillota bacterium]